MSKLRFILIILIVLANLAASAQATPIANRLVARQFIVQFCTDTNRQGELGLIQPETIQAMIEQAAQAWVKGDADAFATLFTPDGEFIVPGNRWVGQAAIRQILTDFAATHSDIQIEIKRITIEGDRAVVEWNWQETENATGRRIQANDAIVVDFEGNKISRWREYIDTETPKQMF